MAATCAYFRPRDYWPAGHGRELHRAPGRRAGRPGRVRGPYADPDVRHRRVADRGREHRHAPHPDLLQRQAPLRLADQLRPAGRRHARRELSDHREGEPGADGRPRVQPRCRGRCGSPSAGTTTTTRTGRWASRASRTSATAASTCRLPTPRPTTTWPCPATPSRSWAAPRRGAWDNGWTEWFLSLAAVPQGQRDRHEAVMAGPSGQHVRRPLDAAARRRDRAAADRPGRQRGLTGCRAGPAPARSPRTAP